MKKAWEIEREIRLNAIPMDRRLHGSNWFDPAMLMQSEDMMLKTFWEEHVPGSGAVEHPYMELMQAHENKGYDLSAAIPYYYEGIKLLKEGNIMELRAVTAALLDALFNAPKVADHPYHKYEHPALWEDVKKAMGKIDEENHSASIKDLDKKILDGWLGQLAGASFGTAIEGYTGTNIAKVYGEVTTYITEPETMNDDITFELILLDVFEKMGRKITSRGLGLEWVKQLPFAWSAEWIALENLRAGYFPPESATLRNPYSNWIGAQMRGMICGMLAPGWPMEAARLAHIDGVVSHSANGVYGEIFAAVLTSLSFIEKDIKKLIKMTAEYIPAKSEYKQIFDDVMKFIEESASIDDVLKAFDDYFKTYNWIHAYPNLGADVFALWFGEGDMTKTFSLLAKAGMDVDCNGGLVGNVLGVIKGVPGEWAEPLGDLLETYLPGKERMSIKELADRTVRLSKVME